MAKAASAVVARRWRGVIPAWNQAPAWAWALVDIPLGQARWAAGAGTLLSALVGWVLEYPGTFLLVRDRHHL